SQIAITRVYFFLFNYTYDGTYADMQTMTGACVNFVNNGPKIVSKVQVNFAYVNANKPTSKPNYVIVRGPIAVGQIEDHVGVPQAIGSGPPGFAPECTLAPGNSAWVAEVDYADGTSWKAPPDAPVSGKQQPPAVEGQR